MFILSDRVTTVGKTILLIELFFIMLILIGTDTAFFWSLFLAFLFFAWDSRYVGALAILALTACPILLSLDLQEYAEQMAVYAYYLLVITVVLQIIEYKRPRKLKVVQVKEIAPPDPRSSSIAQTD